MLGSIAVNGTAMLLKRLLCLSCLTSVLAIAQPAAPSPVASIQRYIKENWKTLERSDRDLAKAAVDPKFKPLSNGKWPVYIPPGENLAAIEGRVKRDMTAADFAKIELRRLPANGEDPDVQGLLYLPKPYVVPGGRFNEMYGWDSFFIQLGLLRDGEISLAKDMADNFLYEIANYGKILNANRTYYLHRSQPPFLTEMLLNVYRKTGDKAWLASALPQIKKYYRFWTSPPHLTPETGLERYYDTGKGPAPEAVSAELNAKGQNEFDLIREYFRTHKVTSYDVSQYYDRRTDTLTPLFYTADRSMRESGFDPSNRFGPFNADIIHYDPVCLNSLLYIMEDQTAEILTIAGRGSEAGVWKERARVRGERIRKLLWDEKDGLFYDYNFVTQKLRPYPYLTTYYPLWAGLATKEQAASTVKNLSKFEARGGLMSSTLRTGEQWDAPYGWAPLELIAVQGLRRYGYNADADRVSLKFLTMVLEEYLRTGSIVEKYDVVQGGANVAGGIRFGYLSNEIGFGWTNAAFTTLYDALPAADKAKLNAVKPAQAETNR
jgi:alpha,alpha-trehalase